MRRLAVSTVAIALLACAPPAPNARAPLGASVADEIVALEIVALEIVATRDVAPSGGDGAPLLTLAFVREDGARVAIEGEATHFVRFRDGAALLRPDETLELVRPDGSHSVLAHESGPPARDEEGALLYVVRRDLASELHRLDVEGADEVLAQGLVGIGVLAPQRDGRVLFVASVNGGVAGLWLADAEGARCITNCDLRTGQPWADAFLPSPGGPDAITIVEGERARWVGPAGVPIEVSLALDRGQP